MFYSFFFPRSLFISLSIHQCLSSFHPSSLYCCLPLVLLHLSLPLSTSPSTSLSLSLTPMSSSLCSFLEESFPTFFSIQSVFDLLLSTPSSPFLVFLFLSLSSHFFMLLSPPSLLYVHLHYPSTSFLSVVMCLVKVRGPSLKCIAKTRVTCAVADKRCAAEVAQRKRNNILHNNNSNNNEGNTQGRSKGGDARKVR